MNDPSPSIYPFSAAAFYEASRRIHPEFNFAGPSSEIPSRISDRAFLLIHSLLSDQSISQHAMGDLQWDELLPILTANGLVPLLYWKSTTFPPNCRPPEAVMSRLRHHFLLSRTRTFQVEQQLRDIHDAFQAENLRMLVIKGPALAHSVYPDPALRTSSDIDILVRPDHVVQSQQILESLGYQCIRKKFEKYKHLSDHELYIKRSGRNPNRPLELHWDFHRFSNSRPARGVSDLFQRALQFKFINTSFKILNPVDALVHRAINNTFVHFKDMRLSWIYDVKKLTEQLNSREEWLDLQQQSLKWRARIAVEQSLKLAVLWTGLRLPEAFSDFSAWPAPTPEEIQAWRLTIYKYKDPFSLARLLINSSAPLSEKIRFIAHSLFPPVSYMETYHPMKSKKKCQALSYAHRWLIWASKYLS